jgi:hypothetical protein
MQILVGSTSTRPNHPCVFLIRDLLYSAPREVLCMIRVYAMYGRSRRVLGILLSIGAAAILFTSVRFHYYARRTASNNRFPANLWAMVATHRDKSETIEVISGLSGCNQYLPSKGYVQIPDPPRVERRSMPCFFLVSAPEVLVCCLFIRTDSWGCAVVTQWSRCCRGVDGRARVRQRDVFPHAVQGFYDGQGNTTP